MQRRSSHSSLRTHGPHLLWRVRLSSKASGGLGGHASSRRGCGCSVRAQLAVRASLRPPSAADSAALFFPPSMNTVRPAPQPVRGAPSQWRSQQERRGAAQTQRHQQQEVQRYERLQGAPGPMKRHLFLTGAPGCGKTTLVRRLVEQSGLSGTEIRGAPLAACACACRCPRAASAEVQRLQCKLRLCRLLPPPECMSVGSCITP